jgi:hypothetical protein
VLPQLIAGSFPRWSVSFPQGPPARGCCFALIDGWIPSSAPSLEDSRFGWSSFGRAGQGQPHLQFGGAATLLPPRIFSVRAVQDHPEQHHLGIGLQRRDQVVEVAADLVWLGILGSPRAGASLLRRPRSSPRRLLASRSCTRGGAISGAYASQSVEVTPAKPPALALRVLPKPRVKAILRLAKELA